MQREPCEFSCETQTRKGMAIHFFKCSDMQRPTYFRPLSSHVLHLREQLTGPDATSRSLSQILPQSCKLPALEVVSQRSRNHEETAGKTPCNLSSHKTCLFLPSFYSGQSLRLTMTLNGTVERCYDFLLSSKSWQLLFSTNHLFQI